MRYHGGSWTGKKTKELEDLSLQYIERFGTWPDGYQDIAINMLDYEDYVNLIKLCLDRNIEIDDYLPDEYFLDT